MKLETQFELEDVVFPLRRLARMTVEPCPECGQPVSSRPQVPVDCGEPFTIEMIKVMIGATLTEVRYVGACLTDGSTKAALERVCFATQAEAEAACARMNAKDTEPTDH